MGLRRSLRAAALQFGGAPDDYDDYDGYDEYADDEACAGPEKLERAARPLALVRPPHIEFTVVAPEDFDDAQRIADHLRAETPVIVDVRSCGPHLAKRLIDFFSGLTYARDGSLESLGDGVVLLTPHHVELSSDSSVGLQARRFFNQV